MVHTLLEMAYTQVMGGRAGALLTHYLCYSGETSSRTFLEWIDSEGGEGRAGGEGGLVRTK